MQETTIEMEDGTVVLMPLTEALRGHLKIVRVWEYVNDENEDDVLQGWFVVQRAGIDKDGVRTEGNFWWEQGRFFDPDAANLFAQGVVEDNQLILWVHLENEEGIERTLCGINFPQNREDGLPEFPLYSAVYAEDASCLGCLSGFNWAAYDGTFVDYSWASSWHDILRGPNPS